MYRYLNKGRAPFLPDYPLEIFPVDLERAFERRINGDPLPLLKNVAPALRYIVMKATAPDRADRFASPTAMREAIEAFKSGKGIDSIKVSRSGKEREPSKDSRQEKEGVAISSSRKAALDLMGIREEDTYVITGGARSEEFEDNYDDSEDYASESESEHFKSKLSAESTMIFVIAIIAGIAFIIYSLIAKPIR
jgi:hypothetical protein